MTTLSPRAFGSGAVTALLTALIGVGLALALRSLADLDHASQLVIVTLSALFGFLLGGFRAGLGCPPAPLSNGAAAAALAYVPMAIVRVGQRVSDDRSVPVTGIVFAGLLATSLGMVGGLIANTANRTRANRGQDASNDGHVSNDNHVSNDSHDRSEET